MKAQALPKSPDHRLEDLAVALVGELRPRFHFRIQCQNLVIAQAFPMAAQHWAKRAEQAALPVDQRAIAVEGKRAELGEIEHEISLRSQPAGGAPSLAAA